MSFEKKNLAHKWFDKLWRNHEERDLYYHRLAEEMNMEYEKCHFSMMTDKELDMAIQIIKQMWWEKYDK